MDLKIAKYGNLTGSPDLKEKLYRAGPDTPESHELFEELFDLKLWLGLNGQCTSLILLEPDYPDMFPALVDFSYLAADPATHNESTVEAALQAIKDAGLQPEQVKSILVTHPHGDHYDPRLLQHLPNATPYSDPGAASPGIKPLNSEDIPGTLVSLNTPGHGGPHASFIVDIPERNVSLAVAGDLIMSHAHFLSLDHPLSFTDPGAGKESVGALIEALNARPTRFKMILPGHDIPFFAPGTG